MTVQFRGKVAIITIERSEFQLMSPLPNVIKQLLTEADKSPDGFATTELKSKPIDWEQANIHNEYTRPTTGLRKKVYRI